MIWNFAIKDKPIFLKGVSGYMGPHGYDIKPDGFWRNGRKVQICPESPRTTRMKKSMQHLFRPPSIQGTRESCVYLDCVNLPLASSGKNMFRYSPRPRESGLLDSTQFLWKYLPQRPTQAHDLHQEYWMLALFITIAAKDKNSCYLFAHITLLPVILIPMSTWNISSQFFIHSHFAEWNLGSKRP